ncbi:MAG: 50S ribosomal protein L6 [Candidatus Moranbacteria bacterium CG_4_10_14_3_um_filter_45_9]|nr:MAG: 50S ribosomal protein L6 [Candidatus Moranbacteria bacterium CG_4_10_14_3_um_filter_45_9]
MSRIGKKPVSIPSGVEVTLSANVVAVKGPKGTLEFAHSRESKVAVIENEVLVTKVGETKKARATWGTTAKLISNMIAGVTNGFQKQLELNGVGFRMVSSGKKLTLALGFSHPVERILPDGLEVKIENNVLTISGIDKQKVGEFAAVIRKLKPVEPYKGKGFRYVDEVVRHKEGKKAAA